MKDHGPVTDGYKGTGELRVYGGERVTFVVFSEVLAYPRKVAWTVPPSELGGKRGVRSSLLSLSSSVARVFSAADDLSEAKDRIARALEQKVISKTSSGAGVRIKVKGRWVKLDVAKLNSCHTKLHFGLGGGDFSPESEREVEDERFNFGV